MKEEQKNFFGETQELVENYVKNRLLLFKLQTAEKSAKLVSLVFTGLILALLCFFILFFLSIMAGYYFAEKTGSMFYGFGIVTAIYLVLFLLLLYLRKKFLNKYISDTVIRVFFDSTEIEEDDKKD